MSFILKVMSNEDIPDNDARKTYCLYSDVDSVSFSRQSDGTAMAHLWVKEPVKTAMVPGFVEVEKHVQVTGNCYLMNENGKTISTFSPARYAKLPKEGVET